MGPFPGQHNIGEKLKRPFSRQPLSPERLCSCYEQACFKAGCRLYSPPHCSRVRLADFDKMMPEEDRDEPWDSGDGFDGGNGGRAIATA
jgi:hypothetical protein